MLGGNIFLKNRFENKPPIIDSSFANGELTTHKAARGHVGNPKFGFQTLLDRVRVPLPTAPAIVGGNVDWANARASPFTHFLSGKMSNKRGMMSPPALGSFLNLKEPNVNSIHHH
jgi:hypothetical protein